MYVCTNAYTINTYEHPNVHTYEYNVHTYVYIHRFMRAKMYYNIIIYRECVYVLRYASGKKRPGKPFKVRMYKQTIIHTYVHTTLD